MTRDTGLSPLLTTLAQSQFLYAGVAMSYDVHLRRTSAMTAQCRHYTVAPLKRQSGASLLYFRPLARTANPAFGYATFAMAALYCAAFPGGSPGARAL